MSLSINLSERQQRIVDFIHRYISEYSYPPTIREIGEAADISSTSVVKYNLSKLADFGILERDARSSRGIRLRHESVGVLLSATGVRVPLYGTITAGAPIMRPDLAEAPIVTDTIELTRDIVREPENVYALRVRGDSMIDALVRDGDLIVLRSQRVAESGEMVAAWLPERSETTLKYFYREGRNVRLQPANPAYKPLIFPAEEVEIQGKVIAIIRQLD